MVAGKADRSQVADLSRAIRAAGSTTRALSRAVRQAALQTSLQLLTERVAATEVTRPCLHHNLGPINFPCLSRTSAGISSVSLRMLAAQ